MYILDLRLVKTNHRSNIYVKSIQNIDPPHNAFDQKQWQRRQKSHPAIKGSYKIPFVYLIKSGNMIRLFLQISTANYDYYRFYLFY